MTVVRPLLFLVPAIWLAAPAAAQPAAVEKAKAKFEADTAKGEEALLAALDRALAAAKAKGNKALAEKLAYEKDLFVGQRIVPTALPAGAYLKARGQAVDALEAAYRPAVKELLKDKKEAEAESLEAELSDLLKSARGYGLALPDLEPRTLVLIENKASGTVLELAKDAGQERVVLAPKAGKKRPAQCWALEREEKGVVIRSAASGYILHALNYGEDAPPLYARKADPAKETPEAALFKLAEGRHEVGLVPLSKFLNGKHLSTSEKKVKGVTSYELALERKADEATPNQQWVISEAK